MRKNVDVKMHSERMSKLRPSLVAALWEPTPRKAPKPPDGRLGRRTRLLDETIAAIRGDFELRGMTRPEIVKKYGLLKGQVYNVLSYGYRSNIEPK